MEQRISIHSLPELYALGRRVASQLSGGDVIALTGELGSGKTTFVQGLAKALDISERVLSPTFVCVHSYPVHHRAFAYLHHIDCWRFDAHTNIALLGLAEYIGSRDGVAVIEWADRILRSLPHGRLSIHCTIGEKRTRTLVVTDTTRGGKFIHGIETKHALPH